MASQEHAEEKHASIKTYTYVAIFLFAITIVEVALPGIADHFKASMGEGYPRGAFLFLLIALSVIKFFYVVAFFMHLRYDKPLYSQAFGASLAIAVATFLFLAYFLSPKEPPNQRMARLKKEGKLPVAAAVAPVEEDLQPGDPEAGKAVFMSAGCMACHTVTSVDGAIGTTGPKLDGLGQTAAGRVSGLDAEGYIRQSVEDPYAFVVDGYMKIMPNMRQGMTGQNFEDLVAFLKGL